MGGACLPSPKSHIGWHALNRDFLFSPLVEGQEGRADNIAGYLSERLKDWGSKAGAKIRGGAKGALPPPPPNMASIRQTSPPEILALGGSSFRKFWANFRKKWPSNAIKFNFGQKLWIFKNFAGYPS